MSKIHKSHDNEEHVHFRRCHICGVFNERSNELVDRCDGCGKAFAPFVFFDERRAMGINIEKEEEPTKRASSYKMTRLATQSIYPPIWGLTVYW